MSTAPPPAHLPSHAAPRAKKEPNELTIISHSNLYYWWPVWAIGFIMALITWWEGYVMAVVPKSAVAYVDATKGTFETPAKNDKGEVIKDNHGDEGTVPNEIKEPSVVIKAPQADDKDHRGIPVRPNGLAENPYLHVSPHKGLGVAFVLVLLLVISITNVPLRGMWSVVIIVIVVATTIVFIVLGWWEVILNVFWMLDIRINMGGYLTISITLLILWLSALLFFDKQRYITVTPGQLKVCDEVGGGEQVYSTDGMTLQKQRSDFFRHYVLGLGSGDLIIRTTGAQAHHIDLPNVLFINAKVRQIEHLLKTKNVIEMK
jgi:hypothetical protein